MSSDFVVATSPKTRKSLIDIQLRAWLQVNAYLGCVLGELLHLSESVAQVVANVEVSKSRQRGVFGEDIFETFMKP